MVRDFERRHVIALMGQRAETPASANNLRKMLRKLFAHAIDIDMIRANPVRDVPAYSTAPGGFHTWTEAEIARFFEVHGPGTLAHLAVTLILYTGAARVDAVRLGWANIRGARLAYRRRKTEGKVDVEINIPIHAELAAALQLAPRDAETFLATRSGAQRSPAGFGNSMRAWCDSAGLSQCSAHGLRKAIARRLAEAGATAHEIMSVTGHTSLSEAERYTREAVRSTMADKAMARLAAAQETLTNLPKGSPEAVGKALKRR